MKRDQIFKIIVMTGLISLMIILTFYFHGVLRTGKVFTHFFYIPIALASMWWKRRGIYVSLFLSMVLILSHIFIRGYVVTGADYIRAVMFLIVGGIIALLSEELVKERRAKELFAVESVTDALTGLRNYTFFKKNAEALFDISKDCNSPFSIVIIDIDGFKNINDTYGHKAGDLILKNFGTAAIKAFRKSDIIIRYGGDEFVVLLPGVSKAGLSQVIERLKKCIQEKYVQYDGKVVSYNFSWGAAEYDGIFCSLEEMFVEADSELYRAKKKP